MGTENHPVWAVYDKLRSAKLNVKYYCRRLQYVERLNFFIELTLAATAPSSAVAGLWFWNTSSGHSIWKCSVVVAAIVALLKPLLGLTRKIKDHESVISGYRILEYDLDELKTMIEQKQKYEGVLQADFKRALQKERTLVSKTPETREIARIKKKCEREVNQELPVTSFFIPQERYNVDR